MAEALEHELDHLNGRLFFQLLSEPGRMAIRRQLRQLEQQFEQ